MAKRSSIDELRPSLEAIKSLRSQGSRPIGSGYDYVGFRVRPVSPPVAKFFRAYVTLREALLRIRAESPRNQPSQKPFIREGCAVVLKALGDTWPWNYEAAEDALHDWSHRIFTRHGFVPGQQPFPSVADHREDVAAAAELLLLVSRLIVAYADPHRFFQEVLPEDDPESFETVKLRNPYELGRMFWRWGFGLLFNREVREAFDSAPPEHLIEILGSAEGRARYREGNPKGRGKGIPKKKRVDPIGTKVQVTKLAAEIETTERLERGGTKLAIEKIAKSENRSPSAIKKRMSRASNK